MNCRQQHGELESVHRENPLVEDHGADVGKVPVVGFGVSEQNARNRRAALSLRAMRRGPVTDV